MGSEEPALRVKLFRSARAFESAADETVLDAALRAGLDVPHRCKGGNCGACRARLLEGEVVYPNGRPLGLSDVETADGLVLLCRAHAHSDLLLETFAPGTAGALHVKRLPCRVERLERLAHDVMALYLRLPPAESFDFKPGQYIDVLLSKGRRRSFSIASPPHDARPLELHVRRAAGGEFSEQVFAEDMRGAVLHLEGPLGNSVYREIAKAAAPCAVAPGDVAPGDVAPGVAAPPLRLVGGGTGRSKASCATFSSRACLGARRFTGVCVRSAICTRTRFWKKRHATTPAFATSLFCPSRRPPGKDGAD
jgi:ferredoxin